jgi:hypothetical protein
MFIHRLQELEDCSEDVALRHSLWASRTQWALLTDSWLNARLDEVGDMCPAGSWSCRVLGVLHVALLPDRG